MALKSDAKFKKNLLVVPKMTWGLWWIFIRVWKFAIGYKQVWKFAIAYKVSAKNVQKNSFMTLKKDRRKEKKSWLFIWQMTWQILTWAVESLKICTLMGYFGRQYVMFELQRYRGVMSWKMTYSFKNDIRNLVNFHTSSLKQC